MYAIPSFSLKKSQVLFAIKLGKKYAESYSNFMKEKTMIYILKFDKFFIHFVFSFC